MFGMSLVATILSGFLIQFIGFVFTGSVYFTIERKKTNSYDSFLEMGFMFCLWEIYLLVTVFGILGTIFGKFILFVEGKK